MNEEWNVINDIHQKNKKFKSDVFMGAHANLWDKSAQWAQLLLNVHQQQVYSESESPFQILYAAARFLWARMLIRLESSASVCVWGASREVCVFPELCSLAADLHSRLVFGAARGHPGAIIIFRHANTSIMPFRRNALMHLSQSHYIAGSWLAGNANLCSTRAHIHQQRVIYVGFRAEKSLLDTEWDFLGAH